MEIFKFFHFFNFKIFFYEKYYSFYTCFRSLAGENWPNFFLFKNVMKIYVVIHALNKLNKFFFNDQETSFRSKLVMSAKFNLFLQT